MIDKRDVFSLGGLDLVNEVIDMYEQKDKIKVLDVGCGSGYSVNYFSLYLSNCDLSKTEFKHIFTPKSFNFFKSSLINSSDNISL